ncbi:hypothetical protein ACFL2V_04530 [Pseudomonadota bacterium]
MSASPSEKPAPPDEIAEELGSGPRASSPPPRAPGTNHDSHIRVSSSNSAEKLEMPPLIALKVIPVGVANPEDPDRTQVEVQFPVAGSDEITQVQGTIENSAEAIAATEEAAAFEEQERIRRRIARIRSQLGVDDPSDVIPKGPDDLFEAAGPDSEKSTRAQLSVSLSDQEVSVQDRVQALKNLIKEIVDNVEVARAIEDVNYAKKVIVRERVWEVGEKVKLGLQGRESGMWGAFNNIGGLLKQRTGDRERLRIVKRLQATISLLKAFIGEIEEIISSEGIQKRPIAWKTKVPSREAIDNPLPTSISRFPVFDLQREQNVLEKNQLKQAQAAEKEVNTLRRAHAEYMANLQEDLRRLHLYMQQSIEVPDPNASAVKDTSIETIAAIQQAYGRKKRNKRTR